MKKLKSLILISLATGGTYLTLPYLNNPVEQVPKPYILNVEYSSETHKAEKSNILITGDRLGANLTQYIDSLIDRTRDKLEKPLKVYNWARRGEGLHRTLAKVKSLKRLPEIIIYHGGTEEFFEKRLEPKYQKIILKNYQRHQNKKLHSLILTFPFLSKLIYQPYPHTIITGEYRPLEKTLSSQDRQKIMELTYLTYTAEYREFTEFLRERDANLIVIAPPHNLDITPKSICQNATNPRLEAQLKTISNMIEKGQTKSAIPELQKILKKNLGNAQVYYLLGQALKKIGLFKDAKSLLYRAQTFDCHPFRGNMVFNRIQIQIAEKNEFDIIDFNKLVNTQFGQNVLFIDDIFPQNIFYDQLINKLTQKIEDILKI